MITTLQAVCVWHLPRHLTFLVPCKHHILSTFAVVVAALSSLPYPKNLPPLTSTPTTSWQRQWSSKNETSPVLHPTLPLRLPNRRQTLHPDSTVSLHPRSPRPTSVPTSCKHLGVLLRWSNPSLDLKDVSLQPSSPPSSFILLTTLSSANCKQAVSTNGANSPDCG